jgi:iron complex transport system ATP-binding protein
MNTAATTPATALLQTQDLCLQAGSKALLRDITLQLQPGELLGLIGPNGAGKSSLLRVLAGIEQPDRGQLLLQGRPLAQLSAAQRARHIAWLEQRPQLHWPLPVHQVVALGRLPWRHERQPDATAQVEAALARCGLQALRTRDFSSLSEGEKLLVNLARTLAVDAAVLLADEPTSALDPRQQLQVMSLLQSQAQAGKAVLAVLHDLGLAARYCNRLALLHEGRLVACGPAEQVLTPALLLEVYRIHARFDAATRSVLIAGPA